MTEARSKILQAAFQIFSQFGYQATTTQKIAQKAKVNEVTIFRLFGSKQNLFSAVLDEFIILKSISSINEELLFAKHNQNPTGFFRELGFTAFTYFKETFPFIKMQIMETGSSKLEKEVIDKIAQIPLQSKSKLIKIFQKCVDKQWLSPQKSYDALLLSFYGPFMAYLMNKNSFGNRIFEGEEKLLVEELVNNFLQICSKTKT